MSVEVMSEDKVRYFDFWGGFAAAAAGTGDDAWLCRVHC